MGDDSFGLLAPPRGVRILEGSLFLSDTDEPTGFFGGRTCDGFSGWRGFSGCRGLSSLSEVLEPLFPVRNKYRKKNIFLKSYVHFSYSNLKGNYNTIALGNG